MARKGNQQKNGVYRHGLNNKKGVSGGMLPGMKDHGKGGPVKDFPREELAETDRVGVLLTACDASSSGDEYNNEQRSVKVSRKERQGMAGKHDLEESSSFESNSGDGSLNSEAEASIQEENGTLPRSNQGQQSIKSRLSCILDSLHLKSVLEKAMLVHPDKNMGNEKAAEAFKKLQNAYEILMDSLKRKAYDDELRREEILSVFRRFHDASRKTGRHGFFPSGFARSDADGKDPFGDSRRIACKRCAGFHVWIHTKKQKSRARWCQDCQDFHQAKDGDGWVEQSSQPLLFGLLQKVDAPSAYVCAGSRIYDATEWYICQGMRCPANTHKPSFHVNTNLMSKHNSGKGTNSGQRGGHMPTPDIEETMTEEELFEWLQNAVHAGAFDNFSGTTTESPSPKSGNGMKSPSGSSAGAGAGGSSSKRKKKGKKQW